MFTKAAIQHLRLRFSILLMPVFWLSVWQISVYTGALERKSELLAILFIFIALHLFIYPGSNAYNSYQDQDKGAIGDIKNPLKAGRDVLFTALAFSGAGLLLAFVSTYILIGEFRSVPFSMALLVYVIASQLYSWRKVRLKKYPIIGFFTVFIFQGFWIARILPLLFEELSCFPSYVTFPYGFEIALAASFLFGGGYPITQIYQHKQDKEDGVKTISMLLGIKGTIIFSGIMNAIGMGLLFFVLWKMNYLFLIPVYLVCMLPVLYKFNQWARAVFKDESQANFENVMRMTWLSGICNNIAFILFIILTYFIKA